MPSSLEIPDGVEARLSTRTVLKEQGTDSGAAASEFQMFCGSGS
jgi:hypothetical protein